MIYALLSLTAVRILPVAVSLVGSGLHLRSHLFLGWFGPRGLASILFVFLVLEGVGIGAKEEIFQVVILTVLFSVFVHGLSAVPGAKLYARFIARSKADQPHRPEHAMVPELPTRLGTTE